MAAMRLAIKGKTPDEIRAMTKEKLNLPTTMEDFMAKIGATAITFYVRSSFPKSTHIC